MNLLERGIAVGRGFTLDSLLVGKSTLKWKNGNLEGGTRFNGLDCMGFRSVWLQMGSLS